MSSRFVRASKYRHVHGEPNRKDRCYLDVVQSINGDSEGIKANKTFVAWTTTGGGGPVAVRHLSSLGRGSSYNVNVHKAKVLDFAFSPFNDSILALGADDGLVKIAVVPPALDAPVEQAAANLDGHTKKIAYTHFNPVADNVLATSAFDFDLKIWDIQEQKQICNFLHGETPHFNWKSDGSQIISVTKEKQVRIFDPRQSSAVASIDSLAGSKPARALFLDNNKYMVVGFGQTSARQYMIGDARMGASLTVQDIDNSAGIISPHYDPDNNIVYLAGKGDATIRYYEVVSDDPALFFLSEFRSNEAHKSVTFLPKLACNVGICEIALGLRLMSNLIQPVSFQVPRKSDLFQEDLYPDTFAGVPAMDAKEWASGVNKPPVTVSMNPANRSEVSQSAKVEFKAARTVADADRELAAANARIKELEAQLAALQAK